MKKLLLFWRREVEAGAPQGTKVFWFFASKKNKAFLPVRGMDRLAKPRHLVLRVLLMLAGAGLLVVLAGALLFLQQPGWHRLATMLSPGGTFAASIYQTEGIGVCRQAVFMTSAGDAQRHSVAARNEIYAASCHGLETTRLADSVRWIDMRTLRITFDPTIAAAQTPAILHGFGAGGRVRVVYRLSP